MSIDGVVNGLSNAMNQSAHPRLSSRLKQQSLRIAFVSYEYPPHVEGGAGVYAHCLVGELEALGHSVSVFTVNRGQERHDETVIPVGRMGSGALGFWANLPARVAKTIRRDGSFDVIHGNSIADLTLPRDAFSAVRVVTLHHVTGRVAPPGWAGVRYRFRDYRGETGVGPIAERIVLGRADRVVAVSDAARVDAIGVCGLNASQVVVIPNGRAIPGAPDPSMVSSLRQIYCGNGELMALAVGRLEWRKGISVLMEALALLPDKDAVRLVLIGDGPIDQYRDLAHQLGIQEQVRFTGRVTKRVRDAHYAACDVFVSAARHEGFGLAIFEAMAMGKPVIVTKTGAAAAGWVAERHGAVIPPGDAGSLRDALSRLLASPAQRRTIGEGNRAYVENWPTWYQVALETQNVYWSALLDRQPGETRAAASPKMPYPSVEDVRGGHARTAR